MHVARPKSEEHGHHQEMDPIRRAMTRNRVRQTPPPENPAEQQPRRSSLQYHNSRIQEAGGRAQEMQGRKYQCRNAQGDKKDRAAVIGGSVSYTHLTLP